MIWKTIKVGFHRLGSPPTFFRLCQVLSPWLWAGFAVCATVGIYYALYVVPPDYQQGDSYRILFVHVPAPGRPWPATWSWPFWRPLP
jgi:heme exporter protein C